MSSFGKLKMNKLSYTYLRDFYTYSILQVHICNVSCNILIGLQNQFKAQDKAL